MTEYQRLRELADFYTTEANKHYYNPIKREIFRYLARKYENKALHLTVGEALR